jgi:hypothetical protein
MDTYPKEAIDAKLDVLRHEFRADLTEQFASVRREMSQDKAELVKSMGDAKTELRAEIGTLKQDFVEFRGLAKGLGIAMTIAIPVITTLLIFMLNRAFPAGH